MVISPTRQFRTVSTDSAVARHLTFHTLFVLKRDSVGGYRHFVGDFRSPVGESRASRGDRRRFQESQRVAAIRGVEDKTGFLR